MIIRYLETLRQNRLFIQSFLGDRIIILLISVVVPIAVIILIQSIRKFGKMPDSTYADIFAFAICFNFVNAASVWRLPCSRKLASFYSPLCIMLGIFMISVFIWALNLERIQQKKVVYNIVKPIFEDKKKKIFPELLNFEKEGEWPHGTKFKLIILTILIVSSNIFIAISLGGA